MRPEAWLSDHEVRKGDTKELRFSVWPVGRKMSGHQEQGRVEDRQRCEQRPVGLWEGAVSTFKDFKGGHGARNGKIEMGRWIEPHCEDSGTGERCVLCIGMQHFAYFANSLSMEDVTSYSEYKDKSRKVKSCMQDRDGINTHRDASPLQLLS